MKNTAWCHFDTGRSNGRVLQPWKFVQWKTNSKGTCRTHIMWRVTFIFVRLTILLPSQHQYTVERQRRQRTAKKGGVRLVWYYLKHILIWSPHNWLKVTYSVLTSLWFVGALVNIWEKNHERTKSRDIRRGYGKRTERPLLRGTKWDSYFSPETHCEGSRVWICTRKKKPSASGRDRPHRKPVRISPVALY